MIPQLQMSEPEPLSIRDKLKMAGLVGGCLFGAIAVWVVLIGIPLGLFYGVTQGDWTLEIAALVVGLLYAIGSRLGWIQPLND
jgi:membrane associated rhomboid family serine protease